MNDVMYSVWFQAQIHSKVGDPIGKIIDLSDPDIFPAKDDKEALEKAFQRADVVEYLKSLRLNRKETSRKFLVRVKTVIRIGAQKAIYDQTRKKGKFK